MTQEAMYKWNELKAEFDARNAKINIDFSNKRKALEDKQRRAKADIENRKYEFLDKIRQEQRELQEKYIDSYRELQEAKCDMKRALEAERQAAYLKFKLEDND